MNQVIALRLQGPNENAAKTMKRGPVKGRSHSAQLQILFQLPQELSSFSLLFMICSLRCWAPSLTLPDWFTQKQHSSFKKRQSPLFSAVSRSQFSSVAQSCLTLCNPMNRSAPGLPVHHQLPEFTQTHAHRVGDGHPAISSSVTTFSSCPQSLPALGSFPMSQLFASGGQSTGVSASASVLPMNTQDDLL